MNEPLFIIALVSIFILGVFIGLGFRRRDRISVCDICHEENIYMSKKCSNCLRNGR